MANTNNSYAILNPNFLTEFLKIKRRKQLHLNITPLMSKNDLTIFKEQ